jgi:hypothetical protein
MSMTTILNHGVYGFTEAARLTGLKRSRIREWFPIRPPEKDRKPNGINLMRIESTQLYRGPLLTAHQPSLESYCHK